MNTSYAQLTKYGNRAIRVAKYVRCSSDEQKKNGYTIADQLNLLDDFIVEHSLISVGEYVDEGVSATLEISKRKELSRLIADAKAGKVDIVLIKCIDRFFRSVEEYYACQRQLRKAGVTWLSIEEPDLDPDNDDAAFKINIYLTMAEYEAKKTSKRILFNNKMRIRNKQVITGTRCFLFPWVVEGEPRNRHLVKNPDRIAMTMDVLDYYERVQSKSATVKYINTRYGFKMQIGTLTKVLSSTLLYGEYKGIPDYVEPFISKERYDRIQDIMTRNVRATVSQNRVFLFSGLIKCPGCGRTMVGNYYRNYGKYDVYTYRCNAGRVQKICPMSSAISEKMLERQLLDNLAQYIGNEIVRVQSIEDSNPQKRNTEKIAEIKAEMDRLNTVFRKGRISEVEYDAEYIKLERQLKKHESVPEPPKRDLEALKHLAETDYRGLYECLSKENKRAFWRNFIKEFSIDCNKRIVPESIVFF